MIIETSDDLRARVGKMKDFLRDSRIKENVDYAVMVKYGEVSFLCCEVWKDSIQEAAKLFNVEITRLYTFM